MQGTEIVLQRLEASQTDLTSESVKHIYIIWMLLRWHRPVGCVDAKTSSPTVLKPHAVILLGNRLQYLVRKVTVIYDSLN